MERYASLAPMGTHRGPASTDPTSATSEVTAAPAPMPTPASPTASAEAPATAPTAAPAKPTASPAPHGSPATSGDRTSGDPDAGTTARPAADA